jgi:hypothetical protein
VKGDLGCSKQQRTSYNQNVNAPMNETIGLINQDKIESSNDETHVPPQVDNITQLRRKVRDSAIMKEKLTQIVAELKNEVRDLKRHAEESEVANTKIVDDLKQNYWELMQDKQRDKKSVTDVSVCHLLLHCS